MRHFDSEFWKKSQPCFYFLQKPCLPGIGYLNHLLSFVTSYLLHINDYNWSRGITYICWWTSTELFTYEIMDDHWFYNINKLLLLVTSRHIQNRKIIWLDNMFKSPKSDIWWEKIAFGTLFLAIFVFKAWQSTSTPILVHL